MNRSFYAHIRSFLTAAILTAGICFPLLPATAENRGAQDHLKPAPIHKTNAALSWTEVNETGPAPSNTVSSPASGGTSNAPKPTPFEIPLPGAAEFALVAGGLIWIFLQGRKVRKTKAALEVERKWCRQLNDELTQTREQYRYLFEMTPSSIMLLDKEGRVTDINPYHITYISKGKTRRKEFIGNLIKERQSIRNAGLSEIYENLFKGIPFDLRAVYFPTTTAGTEGYFNVKGAPLAKDGVVVGAIAVHEDITERIQNEKALAESRSRFMEMANLLPNTICELDLDLKLTYVNRAGLELFGYTREETQKGIYGIDLIHPEDRQKALKRIELRLNGEKPEPSEYRMLKRDGSEVPVLLGAVPRYSDGRITGFRVSITDITRQKKLQEELLKTRKLESIARLAGGLAHDLNNALAAVMGYISLARMNAGPGEKSSDDLREAEKAALTARDLANKLLTFSKGGTPYKKKASIKKVLEASTQQFLCCGKTDLTLSIPEKLPRFRFDENQMKEAFRNVLTNARESMPEGGNIHITAENTAAGESGPCVRITVRDQGAGIPPQDLDKIFDPYFSTKERGAQKGMGLGLSISYSIIQKHGGEVDVNSLPGRGTTVTITLPTDGPAIP